MICKCLRKWFELFLLMAIVAGLSMPAYSASVIPLPKANGKIAFARQLNNNLAVYVMDADGSNQVALTDASVNFSDHPVYSPDGNRIAFTTTRDGGGDEQVYLMNADGSNQTRLTSSLPAGLGTEDPAWSSDGAKLVFVAYTGANSVPAPGSGLYVINADGSNLTKITSSSAETDATPVWSPDGTKIAFRRVSNNPGIYTINADGSGEATLVLDTTLSTLEFKWSPDGTRIAFQGYPTDYPTNPSGIFLVNPDGSNLTRLNNIGGAGTPSVWSPDGAKLAFHTDDVDGVLQIFVINADGSNQIRLTTTGPVGNAFPVWSPDNTKLAFTSFRFATTQNQSADIYTVNADGSNEVRLTASPPFNGQVNWQALPKPLPTPAGSNVAVQAGPVGITFGIITSPGTTTVSAIDPASAGPLSGQYALTGGANFAYEIKTTASYTGPIQICFNVPAVNDVAAFANLRVLHGEGGVLVDRTILSPDSPAPDFATRTLCARVNSLSPFVIARAPTYVINALYDQTKAKKSGSTVPIKLQLLNTGGANVSAPNILVTALSVTQVSTNAPGVLEDAGNANPDNNFRYDSTLGGSGGGYIFNLKTTGYPTGTYKLNFKAGNDSTTYSVQFQVK